MSAPTGPRQPIQFLTDYLGPYKLFTGKHCQAEGCGVQLTSRNRYDHKLKCKAHGRTEERQRVRTRSPKTPRTADATTPTRKPKESFEPCPFRQQVHAALSRWLNSPTAPEPLEELERVMDSFELRTRLLAENPRFGLAPVAPPVEAPVSYPRPDPNVRTIRRDLIRPRKSTPVSFEQWLSEPADCEIPSLP